MEEKIAHAADDIGPSGGVSAVLEEDAREQFLEEMDAVMPWAELLALVSPYYSKGEMGRKPVGLAMLSYGPSTQRSSEQPVMPEIRPGL